MPYPVKGAFGSKSDVWSFGVTLWEILTFAREQPYEALSDKEVLENLNDLSDSETLVDILHQPYNCPRDVYELMLECWSKDTDDRPDFQVRMVLSSIICIILSKTQYKLFPCRKFIFS